MLGGPNKSEILFCPVCRVASVREEWTVVFRRIRSGQGTGPAKVFRHRPCNEIVYFLVE